MNWTAFAAGIVGTMVGLTLLDFVIWLLWGRREDRADQARQDRLDALSERFDVIAHRAHDGYMGGNAQPDELAYNVAELADALSTLTGELAAT